ncbi:EpsG family protein [Companilactobacillus allii]|nr:EpsG family protein [Companilactobacillus allii]
MVGTDTLQYVDFYLVQNSGFNGNGAMVYSAISNAIFNLTGGNYHVFLFVLSLATIFFVLKSIELLNNNENFMFLSIYIYLTFYFYFESFNIQRQMLAVAMTMFAMALLSRKKYIWSIIIFVLSIGIHSTAIFAIIGFVIWFMKKNKITFCLILGVSLLSNLFLNNLLNNFSQLFNHYQMYSDTVLSSGGGSLMLGIFLLLIVIIAMFLTDMSDDKVGGFVTFMTMIGAVLYIVGSKSQLIIRMADYFAVYSVVFIPQVLARLSRKFHRRYLYMVLVGLVLGVGLAIFYYKLGNNLGEVIPYGVFD